jgi:hypothetical protein
MLGWVSVLLFSPYIGVDWWTLRWGLTGAWLVEIRGFLRHSLWSDLSQILSSPAAWPLSGLYRVLSSSVSEE